MAERSISVQEVIAQAMLLFPLQDSRDEMVFTEWSWQALRQIGPSNVDTFRKCIDIEDLCFAKPCGFISDIEINLLDDTNSVLDFEQTLAPTLDSDANDRSEYDGRVDLHSSYRGQIIKLTESKDCYVLSNNDSSKIASKAEIVYYGYPLNEEGEMMIEENMEKAIIHYIEWMWTRRERRRDRESIPLSEERSMQQDWINALRQAKARIKMVSPAAADTIFRKWVSAIPNFQNKPKYRRGSRYRSRY